MSRAGVKVTVLVAVGKKEHVGQDSLDLAARFAKYAIASYGKFGFEYKNEK